MTKIVYEDGIGKEFIPYLSEFFKVPMLNEWGETSVHFNNKLGVGSVRNMVFNYGVNLMRFDISFREDTDITFVFEENVPMDFIFLTKGTVNFIMPTHENHELKSY